MKSNHITFAFALSAVWVTGCGESYFSTIVLQPTSRLQVESQMLAVQQLSEEQKQAAIKEQAEACNCGKDVEATKPEPNASSRSPVPVAEQF